MRAALKRPHDGSAPIRLVLVGCLLVTLGAVEAAPPPATPDPEYDSVCGPVAPVDDLADQYLSVVAFGANGSDGADDLAALRLAAAALCDRSDGETRRKTLYFPNGTYHLEGYRVFDDVDFANWGVLYSGCTDVRIFGCGSTIEVVPFARTWEDAGPPYESFFYSHEFQRIPFLLDRAVSLELRGFVLDGNAEDIVLDAVINAEGPDVGVMTLACRDYRITDVESRRMLSDGFLIGLDLPDDRDFVFDNIRAEHNCRNGLSLIQARHGSVIHSRMNFNGDCGARSWDGATYEPLGGFSPRAGVTLEPDCFIGAEGCEAFDSKAGNIVFDDLWAEGNWGFGLASAHSNRVENVTVIHSTLKSTPPGARGGYCSPDLEALPPQPLAGPGECSDPLWLNDGHAEDLVIHASKGRVVLAGGGSRAGDEVAFINNQVDGGSVLLLAGGNYEGPALVDIQGNQFYGVYDHGPLEPLQLLSIVDTRSCNTRSWRFVGNYVEIPAGHRDAAYFNSTITLGLLAESSANTFVSLDPTEPFYMVYDDTSIIADQLVPPTDAWDPLSLAGCVDGLGLVSFNENVVPSCADDAFEACDGIAGEVPGMWFQSHETLAWWPEYQAGTYELYRDDIATLSAGAYGLCAQTGLTATNTTDPMVPAPDHAWFYLVTSRSASGSQGAKGFGALGERLGNLCP